MKKMKLAVLALALTGIFAAGNALASDQATVDVTATVSGTCAFDTTSYTMDFGSFATTDSGAKTANVDLAFTCTNNQAWTLTDVGGSHTLVGGTTSYNLPYTITQAATTGNGTGATQTVTLSGSIAQADYSAADADTYGDTLTIDINP